MEGDSAHAPAATPPPPLPASVMALERVLHSLPGYDLTADGLQKLAANYGHLDLEEEAIKLKSWLQDPRNQRQSCNTRRILRWLKRAAVSARGSDPPPLRPTAPRMPAAPPAAGVPAAAVPSPFANF